MGRACETLKESVLVRRRHDAVASPEEMEVPVDRPHHAEIGPGLLDLHHLRDFIAAQLAPDVGRVPVVLRRPEPSPGVDLAREELVPFGPARKVRKGYVRPT